MAIVKFNQTDPLFFSTLQKNVKEYFLSNNIKLTGNLKLYSKKLILGVFIAGL